MNLNTMIENIKAHPDYRNVGMIASHLGMVRSFSRDGGTVSGMDVHFDERKIEDIIKDIKSRPGIVEILIETNRGHLAVGDEIVAVVVAGDIRDNVFPALFDAVNRLKTEASTETEFIIE
ncbi:MAG: molybdenum cofactor biosynthesis protein MoaE [Deltaproteobacteria bacterium]|nr:molybdenum cofactor biosynthesis protein MoaE [Deltaproteobacteria bacterium]MBW2076174.1 molybdenum cofactor biosynthesis protein MoaE [Deltaproteobacteria bacterium]MBW2310398.1 molybdenum cofactor biosynthesis protein MoaE [Deltaproteobacteria bacterium]RLB31111.1 MAG: molybdenum cofactor biosynthesis protein MoaE [Deltaproteobacteria bacterium]